MKLTEYTGCSIFSFDSMDGSLMYWNVKYDSFDIVADLMNERTDVIERGVVIDRTFYESRGITHDYADFMHLIHAHIYHNRDKEDLVITGVCDENTFLSRGWTKVKD